MLQISVDLEHYLALAEATGDPTIHMAATRAAQRVAEYVQTTWQLVAEGYRIPGMQRGIYDPAYAASIKTVVSPTHVDVFTTDEGAMQIQSGRPPVDLKPGLLSGPSARTSHDGHRYTIVPLRHATPGNSGQHMLPALPNDVYMAALRGQRITPMMEMGQRNQRPGWSVGPYVGLRREVAPGGKRGHYYTYRAVSDHTEPSKWVLPALPPQDIRGAVWDYVKPGIEAIIEEEMRR
jgi:hypothetical protein